MTVMRKSPQRPTRRPFAPTGGAAAAEATRYRPQAMAQTKHKRKRKHRGTPAGTIDRAGRTGRPRTREELKKDSRARRQDRLNQPPTWSSAVKRAAIAAVVFGVLVTLAFQRGLAQGAALAVFMFVLYIPLGYATDSAVYRFRQRRKPPAGASKRK